MCIVLADNDLCSLETLSSAAGRHSHGAEERGGEKEEFRGCKTQKSVVSNLIFSRAKKKKSQSKIFNQGHIIYFLEFQ